MERFRGQPVLHGLHCLVHPWGQPRARWADQPVGHLEARALEQLRHQLVDGQPDLLPHRLQRHPRRDVVLCGPAVYRRGCAFALRRPPLRVDDPVTDPKPVRRQAHRAQLTCPCVLRRADAAAGQFFGPDSRRAAAAQWRWPHVEHLDSGGDPVLPGIPQQPDVSHAQRQRLR